MTGSADLPPDLAELDRALGGVRFEPRASLGAEIEGRVRRGEWVEDSGRRLRFLRAAWGVAAAVLATVLAGGLFLSHRPVRIDRCCFDLDGGGVADDGVALIAERDARVHRLRLYEDRDHSGTFSAGDLIRLDRGDRPAIDASLSPGLVTTDHCCLDFDGGGPRDDGLLVVGVPPDRVVMAAIYEHRRDAHARRVTDGFPLR